MTERILVVLVNLSLQFILVFIVAQLMVTVFRIRSASARYAVWLVVVLCPLVLIPMNIVSSDIVIFGSNNFDWNRAINLEQMPDNVLNLSSGNAATETQSTDSVTPTQTEPEIPLYMRFLNNVLINLPLILIAVWLIGVSWCFIRLGSGYFRLRKLLSKAYEVRDKGMLEIFDDVRNTIKLSRPVRLFASSDVSVPISIGIIHPCIILPDTSISTFEKGGKGGFERMILIHEMAHLKRFDYLANMICQIIRSFMFFHPIFHLSVRRFELAVEQNCDGMAIGLTGTDTDYAEFLLSLSRANIGRYPVCSAMDGSSLKERVRAILEKKEVFKKMGKRSMVSLLVSILSVVFIVSMVRLADAASFNFAKVDTWTKKANMPTARYWLSTSVVNGKIYIIGGFDSNNTFPTVEEYDPVTNTWKKKADMLTTRFKLSTSVINGKIYAIGGRGNGGCLSTVEEYDPVSDTWTKKANMPNVRDELSTNVVNGKIYAIGGAGIDGLAVSTVEEYDPMSDTWTKKADMPTARCGLSSSVVDGKIYAISGVCINGFVSTVEEYDPVADKWRGNKANIPTERYLLSTSVVNGKIYAIGGKGNGGALSALEEYNPMADQWTKKADMPTARWGLSTSVVNGKIYAIGGYDFRSPLSTVEEYDTGFISENVEAKDKLATKWGKLKGDER